ncbi:cytochrome c maturation protein CcmE [Marinomonas sp. THO17]|uniref:cytochrome c maturation protein CcmE n=1 Tax=Marinomonas sp. THO17 TaxID=3149048 RepID=UPI00336BC845
MHPVRRKRLLWILLCVSLLACALGLVLYALQQNINLFYSPTQIVQQEAPYDTNIRAGGMVLAGSVERDPDSLAVAFLVTDFQHNVRIEYVGILPDLFREGQGIVAQGQLRKDGVFQATEVLAKHDEKYMPPEVTEALQQSQTSSQYTN